MKLTDSEKKNKIAKLLNRLFKMHEHYKSVEDNDYKIQVFDICEPILLELEGLGVKRSFSETFLAFGDEFLVFEFGLGWDKLKMKFVDVRPK